MAQSTSSLPSPSSQRSSPAHSVHSQHKRQEAGISVESLISHLVAAKRSLSSIHLVHHATTVLSDARSTVESTAALVARTRYLRRSLASQLKILRGIQFEIEAAAQVTKSEINVVLGELEETHRRLTENIDELKATRIEDGFKDTENYQIEGHDHPGPKDSLYDFVDIKPVEELKAGVQEAVDNIDVAVSKIDGAIRTLEDDLQSINEGLNERTATSSSTRSDLQPDVVRLLRTLEDHAHEMAVSLESLVKHFDLCVTAIRHTEGAGAAVASTVNAEDLPDGGVDVFEGPTQPLTEEERMEMLQVLENDANEVNEVVTELQERRAEMDVKLDQLIAWRESKELAYNDVAVAFRLLEKVGARLSAHMAENARFSNRWAEEKVKIDDGMAGMEELCDVYERFLNAYDGLIVEAARRRTIKKQMEKIATEAQARLEQLYDDDLTEREVFRAKRGDFLPSDIWAGLSSLPPRFAFQRVDDGDDSIPELPRKTVEQALRRLKAGLRGS